MDSVAKVEVLVDGTAAGTATYGSSRTDIATVFPNAPANAGFTYSLDSTTFSNGAHILNIQVTDATGNVAILANDAVTVSN